MQGKEGHSMFKSFSSAALRDSWRSEFVVSCAAMISWDSLNDAKTQRCEPCLTPCPRRSADFVAAPTPGHFCSPMHFCQRVARALNLDRLRDLVVAPEVSVACGSSSILSLACPSLARFMLSFCKLFIRVQVSELSFRHAGPLCP